ncbi:MAG: hypothetical protein AAF353_05880 [Pseudomonadota bacterium]
MKTFNRSLIAAVGMLLLLSACSGGSSSDDNNNMPAANGRLYVSDFDANRVFSFSNANSVDGNMTPITVLAGANTTFDFPAGIAVDTANDYLYVANVDQSSILVFHNASTVTGNIAPDRTITGGSLINPVNVVYDNSNDRLYVAGNHGINIYDNASMQDGATAPSRSITGQSIAGGLFYDATSDRLFGRNQASVFVYDSASSANGTHAAEVDRTLTGMATNLGVGEALFVDTQDRLYVSERNSSQSVLVWNNASTVDGNLAPDRILVGAATGFNEPYGLFIHPATDELFVANQIPKAVYVFSDAGTLDGDIAPIRSLTGAATQLTNTPFGLTIDTTRD